MGIGTREMVIFLVIVLIIFGPKNLPRLAKAMGQSVRELKNGLSGLSEDMKDTMRKDEPPPVNRHSAQAPPVNPHAAATDAQPVERAPENTTPRSV